MSAAKKQTVRSTTCCKATPGEEGIIGALHQLYGLKEILLAMSIAADSDEPFQPSTGSWITMVGITSQIIEQVNHYMVEIMGNPFDPPL